MIEKTMLIGDFCEQYPDKVDILLQAGMHCLGCFAAQGETIEEACMVHGIDVDELIDILNIEDTEEDIKEREEAKKINKQ